MSNWRSPKDEDYKLPSYKDDLNMSKSTKSEISSSFFEKIDAFLYGYGLSTQKIINCLGGLILLIMFIKVINIESKTDEMYEGYLLSIEHQKVEKLEKERAKREKQENTNK